MRKERQTSRRRRLILLLASSLLHAAEVPAPERLIQVAVAAQKAQDDKGWKFTYREDEIRPESRKTYDVIMLEGDNYRKLVLIDDKPLDSRTQKKVDDDLAKARAARRKGVHLSFSKNVNFGRLDQLVQFCDFTMSGEESLDGRKTWRVNAEPKPGLKPANKQEEQILSAHHTLWFDQEDGFLVRRSDLSFRAADGVQPGNSMEIYWKKLGDAWVTDRFVWRYDVRFNPLIRTHGEVTDRFYDYKRFQVESSFTPN